MDCHASLAVTRGGLKVQRLILFAGRINSEALLCLLDAIKRNIDDSQVEAVSGETRFDAAYKAIMQSAMLGLWLNGYRTSTSQPGHHQTAIQTLPMTLGVDKSVVIILDALRKQRNVSDYEGDPVSDEAVKECIKQAGYLLNHLQAWIRENRKELGV